MKYDNKTFQERYNAWKEGADYWKDLRGVDFSTKLESSPTVSLDDLFKHANEINIYQNFASLDTPKYDDGKNGFYNSTADLIAGFESFIPVTRNIGDGKLTIGYGTTDPKYARVGAKISKAEARKILIQDIMQRDARLARTISGYSDLPESSRRALVSYDYNYPTSYKSSPKLYKALAEKNWQEAARQMDAGMNMKGFPGLRDRRAKERALFLSGFNEPVKSNKSELVRQLEKNQDDLENFFKRNLDAVLNQPIVTTAPVSNNGRTAFNDAATTLLTPTPMPNSVSNMLTVNNRGKDGYGIKFWQRSGNNLHFDQGKDFPWPGNELFFPIQERQLRRRTINKKKK